MLNKIANNTQNVFILGQIMKSNWYDNYIFFAEHILSKEDLI